MSKSRWIYLFIGLLLIYFLWLTLHNWPDQLTRVIFCDVGQGDAILISQGNQQMLIDGGPDEKVLQCLENNLPWWDRSLEVIIATHADADHITGLSSVLKKYQIKLMLLTPQYKETEEFQAFINQIRSEKGIKTHYAIQGDQLILSPLNRAEIVWPLPSFDTVDPLITEQTETTLSATYLNLTENIENYNDGSISLYLTIGEIIILLTGDLETKGEEALVESGLTKQINVLKAGHHGSKTSTTTAFIAQLRPEFTIISSGKNNRYGHPAKEVLTTLEQVGSHILRTDQLGEITLVSNGQDFWFTF